MSTKTSALTALLGSELTASDLVQITDVSATTTKKMVTSELIDGLTRQAFAFTNTVTVNRAVTGGTNLMVGGLAYRAVSASTAITGTQENEAAFDSSYVVPANSLTAGTTIRIFCQGIHTATTGAETHDMKLKIGSVTLASKTAIDPANNDVWIFDVTVTIRTAGASGALVAAGSMGFGASGSAAMTGIYLASSSIDTTTTNTIACYIDRQATATDADSARVDVFVVRIEG